jgi:hypothetical protein
MWSACYLDAVGFFRRSARKGTHSLIRKRIAAAVGIVALAVTVPLFATGTAQASSPGGVPWSPYMCPNNTNDGASLQGWALRDQIYCWYYGGHTCRYNAWQNGDAWYYYQPSYGPNPSYCPAHAVPTTS